MLRGQGFAEQLQQRIRMLVGLQGSRWVTLQIIQQASFRTNGPYTVRLSYSKEVGQPEPYTAGTFRHGLHPEHFHGRGNLIG